MPPTDLKKKGKVLATATFYCFSRSKVMSVSEWKARSRTVSAYFVLDSSPPLSDTHVFPK